MLVIMPQWYEGVVIVLKQNKWSRILLQISTEFKIKAIAYTVMTYYYMYNG